MTFPRSVWWDGPTPHVLLGDADVPRATEAAARIEKFMAGRPSVFEDPRRAQFRTMSARAELAVSILTGLPWTGEGLVKDGKHSADVGDDVEVRYTEFRPDDPWLMLQERDRKRASSRYVLATSRDGVVFVLRGWAFGTEVLLPAHAHPEMKFPCFALPVVNLRPMRDLR